MLNLYIAPFIIAALITGGLTYSVKKLAEKYKWLDMPSPRKIHAKPIPRLGGVAIVLGFLFLVIGYNLITNRLDFTPFKVWFLDKHLFGVILGALVLLFAGIYDDIKNLKPYQKLIFQVIAAVTVVAFGVSIGFIRLPGGATLSLTDWVVPINIFGHGFQFVVWGDLLTIFWIVLLTNTMNFLDGMDGLAGGISLIAGLSLFFLSLILLQGPSALLAIIFAGSIFGFMPWNFNPAKIFMGDSGSMFLGYMLGVLSVISGGKIATAFLILGIPLLDVIWVVLRRIFHGVSPFKADRQHFHHRLLSLGLSQKSAVLFLYCIAIAFGIVAVLTQTQEKIIAFYWMVGLVVAFALALVVLEWKKKVKNE